MRVCLMGGLHGLGRACVLLRNEVQNNPLLFLLHILVTLLAAVDLVGQEIAKKAFLCMEYLL